MNFFILLFAFLSLSSCGADTVLGISGREAAERLKRGDTAFLRDAAAETSRAELESLAKLHPSAPFYAGLILESAALPRGARTLFEIALESPNPLVREAAARRLLDCLFRGESLPAPLPARLQEEAPDLWNKTLGLIAGPEPREAALALFFDPADDVPPEARLYVVEELRRLNPGLFSPAEEAALAGHLAVSRFSFAEGLSLFRPVLEEDRALFFRYPELLNDLGRCFQYAPAGDEGFDLFLDWDAELAAARAGEQDAVRFRLLFFAGRIARQRGRLPHGTGCFIRALPFAPDPLQEDACIWYILDAALTAEPEDAAGLTAAWMPRWNDGAYFSDLLDRLAQYLAVNRNWGDLARLLETMRETPGVPGAFIAQYACILGRALSAGLYTLPAGENRSGGGAAEPFFRLAYERGGPLSYYRALSASALGEPFWTFPPRPSGEPSDRRTGNSRAAAMEFLNGFFEYGAAAFALPFILARQDELSAAETRGLGAALEKAGQYSGAIRLVSLLMERPDYTPNRADLELFYPRPFQRLIEEQAGDAGLGRELLFALIRTESAFQADVVSRAGAVGLTQLMAPTAADMAGRIKNRGGPDYGENGPPDLRDPETNVHIGAVYLRYLLDRLESPFLAILAYNGGMNRLRRWRAGEPDLPAELFLETIPYAETREYGRKILSAALIYGHLYYDLKMGPFLSDILKND